MKKLILTVLVLSLQGCYPKIEVPGFDKQVWENRLQACEGGLPMAEKLLDSSSKLLATGEVQIKTLLGEPDEHELYTRNEKFFYYDLGKDSCEPVKRLSIRFNALDQAKEVAIVLKDSKSQK